MTDFHNFFCIFQNENDDNWSMAEQLLEELLNGVETAHSARSTQKHNSDRHVLTYQRWV